MPLISHFKPPQRHYFRRLPPPPFIDYQLATNTTNNNYAQYNTGLISIILSFFIGKRAGFFVWKSQ